MTERVTLKVNNQVIERAYQVAAYSHRAPEEVLADWLAQYVDNLPVEILPNDEVLRLCNDDLNPLHKRELRDLLTLHRVRPLNGGENVRLDELLAVYRRMIVRKSRALEVAGARGLTTNLLQE